MADFRRLFYALALVALLAGLTVPASAQGTVAPFQCGNPTAVPPTVRAEGLTELVGDLTLQCTGGSPTAAGQVVPPVNITIVINTNLTSRLLSGSIWSEALLIIDEPHSAPNPTRPILNCGQPGAAPDSGPSGSNVCAIISTGNPAQTYDGTANGYGLPGNIATFCGTGSAPAAGTYSCGRPNVFQGRIGTVSLAAQNNAISWLGVPLDPPGTTTNRTLRITNIRADANFLGVSGNPYAQNAVTMQISINGNTALELTQNTSQIVAFVQTSLSSKVSNSNFGFLQCVGENSSSAFSSGSIKTSVTYGSPSQTTGTVPVFAFQENFASAWKAKNIAMILSSTGSNPGNGTQSQTAAYWQYDGYPGGGSAATVNYPKDYNQNVPGAIYNTESGFMSPGAGVTLDSGSSDPTPNPPFGTDTAQSGSVSATTYFLQNGTGIANAGIANQGTRLQLSITGIPAGAYVMIPEAVYLTNSTGISGVAMLVNTDAAGSGAYSPLYTGTSASSAVSTYTPVPSSGLIVYEILFADPFSFETMSVNTVVAYQPNLNLNQPAPNSTAQAVGGYAPFYGTSAAHQPSSTLPIPRFVPGGGTAGNLFSLNKCACDLLFPFVSASSGYDTGIAIANTSQDNLGVSGGSAALQQSGTVTFWYYGTGNNGGTPPPSQTSNLVPAGQVLTYVLSSGGGAIGASASGLDNRANGFSGYVIAQAQFQYCHAYAFITAVGAGPLSQAVSEGYLGLILDNGSWNCNNPNSSSLTAKPAGLCRTGQSAENLVH